MTNDFVKLPVRGLDLMRVELISGRFLALVLLGVVRHENGKHTLAEYLLQFNRASRTKIAVSSVGVMAVSDLEARIMSAQSESSTQYEFRVLLESGSIEAIAREFVCSLIREDELSEEDERSLAAG
jgi:hypothetical protein